MYPPPPPFLLGAVLFRAPQLPPRVGPVPSDGSFPRSSVEKARLDSPRNNGRTRVPPIRLVSDASVALRRLRARVPLVVATARPPPQPVGPFPGDALRSTDHEPSSSAIPLGLGGSQADGDETRPGRDPSELTGPPPISILPRPRGGLCPVSRSAGRCGRCGAASAPSLGPLGATGAAGRPLPRLSVRWALRALRGGLCPVSRSGARSSPAAALPAPDLSAPAPSCSGLAHAVSCPGRGFPMTMRLRRHRPGPGSGASGSGGGLVGPSGLSGSI